jgi:protein-S-isoprenylcysteine O-methyltransferase Ste14
MALIHSFEKSGNFLFRYRGQIPLLLFAAAIPVIWFTKDAGLDPLWQAIITALGIVASLFGFIVRAYTIATTPKGTSGRNTEKQVAESLNISGIYSTIRHPLYLGNYLMWAGIVIFTYNIWFFLVMSLTYWLYYERIMFTEERFLERKFGDSYLSWSQKVPAFVPTFRHYIHSSTPFSLRSVLRREYSGILATVASFAFIDHLRYYFIEGKFDPWRISTWCLIGAMLLALVLRTLKHHTKILQEADRS